MTEGTEENRRVPLSASGLTSLDLQGFEVIWQGDNFTKDATKAQMMEYTERLMGAVWLIYGGRMTATPDDSLDQESP